MNLRTKEICISKGKVTFDHRKGVNNAKIESSIKGFEGDVCIFTHPYGEGVQLRLEIGTETILISLDENQLDHFHSLIEPYLKS